MTTVKEIEKCTNEKNDQHLGDEGVINLDEESEIHEDQSKTYETVEHYNKGDCCLKLGMLVYGDKEAHDLYNKHALGTGFSVRRDQSRYRYINGIRELREKTFLCHKAGFKRDSDYRDDQSTKGQHLNTRTGCPAHITFKVENGVWEIVKFHDEHNHEFAPPKHRRLLRSARNIPDATKGVIDSMIDAGIGPTKARSYVAKQVGGIENITFTMQDCHNYVQSRKAILIEPSDAQMVINHFKLKQVEDPMFFYTPQLELDSENRLTNFFWRDGVSRLNYDCFGDLVIFDTTFRTNKYNMICAPFVGINHHWQSVLLGCAFLRDETIPSFKWVFEAFLDAMGKAPKTIFTDQDQAMASTIAQVFPGTCHRLCDWHIFKNAAKRIPYLYGKPNFKKKFTKCFYNCCTIEEFESTWKEMIDEWDASENTWLNTLYGLKKKWCPAFTNDIFSANVKSTQRSESMNNVFHRITHKTMTLTEFVRHYDECVEKQREAETYEDFRNNQGQPILRVSVGILNHASTVYTSKIFSMFLKEFENSVAQSIIEHSTDGIIDYYTLQTEGFQRKHIVQFKPADLTISCTCKKFESMGILCCHVLRILNVKTNVSRIPQKYVLRRWTKFAKEGMLMDSYKEPIYTDLKETNTIRLNNLMRKAFSVMNLAGFDEKTSTMAEESMEQLVNKIRDYKGALDASCDASLSSSIEPNVNPVDMDNRPVLNPPSLRPKGETNARIKSREEKRQKKIAKVTPQLMSSGTMMEGNQMSSDQAVGYSSDFSWNIPFTSMLQSDFNMSELWSNSPL